jgi:tRNA (guanine37-N1)-methyltransferase
MDIHVISIFPEMFEAITEQGVVGRAIKNNLLSLTIHNPRDFTDDKHRRVDDRPFGGGPGMVMMVEPLVKAINAAKAAVPEELANSTKVVYMSPQGSVFNHKKAAQLQSQQSLIMIAGRYEGIDERVIRNHVDEEWSVGDYVLSGGELPVMIVVDAVARLLPESLGNSASAEQDSFAAGLLDCPHYTRPENFAGEDVPSVLTGGDHTAIARWRMQQSLGRTWLRRPDLLDNIDLTTEQAQLLDDFKKDL